jgi:hypothetical protein
VVKEEKKYDWKESEGEFRVSEEETIPLKLNPAWAASFKQYYAQLYEEVRRKALGQSFDVKLVALAEALKIRVISKGPPLKYFLLKPVQKFLSRLLGRFKCFRLTRETVTSDYLTEFFKNFEGEFSSLDYSSATDLLNPSCSEQAARSLCEALECPPDIEEAFISALTGHTIEGVRQRWGQLMGSIISFVILCVVNGSVIRFSYELTVGRRVSLKNLPATINGDDGLVRAPHEFIAIWKDVAAVAGLIPSIGKVYVHQTYANINSTSFEWTGSAFRKIHYVNMGLVVGYQRSSSTSSPGEAFDLIDERHASIGSRHRALIESCPFDRRIDVHRAFLKFNKDLLSHLTGIPWYVPEEYGGLGLHPIVDSSTLGGDVDDVVYLYGPTPWELEAVDWLSNHPGSRMTRRLPTSAPIQVRNVWTSLLPFRNRQFNSRKSLSLPDKYDMTEQDIGLLDVSAYYVVPSLVARAVVRPGLPILRRNQRAWKRLRARFDRPLGLVVPPVTPSVISPFDA